MIAPDTAPGIVAEAAIPVPIYAYRLPGFEGPLDVLLRLIEREELDITAISLTLVAAQFIAHIEEQSVRDPALLAEFAAVASRLLLLKTRGLFPRQPNAATSDPDAEVDEDDLVRQLREYRQIKGAATDLSARDRAEARAFAPLAVAAHARAELVPEITLAPAGPTDLLRAVQRRLARQPATPRVLTLVPRVSVGEMAARILEHLRLRPRGDVRLSRLAREVEGCPEVITTFMGILELVRRRRAEAVQAVLFGDIVVYPATEEPPASATGEAVVDG
jgi:segregation and condensation protein A